MGQRYRGKNFVHALVLSAFVGPRPNGFVCNHIDCNPENNWVENLEWVTQSKNVRYAYGLGRRNLIGLPGAKNPNSKLKPREVWLIKKLLASKKIKQKQIAKMFKVTPEAISLINCGINWKHIKYHQETA